MRDVLLQPFRSHKYESLKAILIERRGLTTPERVNKVISGERMGTDFPHASYGVYKRQQALERKQLWGRQSYAKRSSGRCPLQSELIWQLNQTVPH